MTDSVNDKTAENADQHFRYEDLQNPGNRDCGGKHDRKHLIRGGEKNGNQGAEGNGTAGIEIGCRGRKAALGNRTQNAAPKRPHPAGALDKAADTVLGMAFQILHRKIGCEEKGKDLQRIDQGIQESVKHEMYSSGDDNSIIRQRNRHCKQ